MRARRAAVLLAGTGLLTTGCGVAADTAVPRCGATERLAVVAQSVPSAAYVPCLQPLPEGWRASGFRVSPGESRFSLDPERGGSRPVDVVLTAGCDVTGASPERPRAEGVRSSVRVRSVAPTYAGTRFDAFPGGCLRSEFAFARGPHIPLLEELTAAVDLVRRRELQVRLREELGVELDP